MYESLRSLGTSILDGRTRSLKHVSFADGVPDLPSTESDQMVRTYYEQFQQMDKVLVAVVADPHLARSVMLRDYEWIYNPLLKKVITQWSRIPFIRLLEDVLVPHQATALRHISELIGHHLVKTDTDRQNFLQAAQIAENTSSYAQPLPVDGEWGLVVHPYWNRGDQSKYELSAYLVPIDKPEYRQWQNEQIRTEAVGKLHSILAAPAVSQEIRWAQTKLSLRAYFGVQSLKLADIEMVLKQEGYRKVVDKAVIQHLTEEQPLTSRSVIHNGLPPESFYEYAVAEDGEDIIMPLFIGVTPQTYRKAQSCAIEAFLTPEQTAGYVEEFRRRFDVGLQELLVAEFEDTNSKTIQLSPWLLVKTVLEDMAYGFKIDDLVPGLLEEALQKVKEVSLQYPHYNSVHQVAEVIQQMHQLNQQLLGEESDQVNSSFDLARVAIEPRRKP